MRKLLVIFILLGFIGNAQNWDVFNKDYRYNYKYDNSPVVTNVLFAEAVTTSASNTVISTNTIGVVTGTLLTIDQPQFLMKTLVKQANGTVVMYNPSTITIIPTCSVSQSWTFDAANNFNATCVAMSTLSIFNLVDSVRTIIVNNVDSILLSKQFGIIQFPKLYAQNKYYRLVGIESKATYDQNALYGEKVPNAWDFYDYSIGYASCSLMEWTYSSPQSVYCTKVCDIIKTKTTNSNSYVYNVDRSSTSSIYPLLSGYCSSPNATVASTNGFVTLDGSPFSGPLGLSSPSLTENSYYPGFVPDVSINRAVVVKLGKDNTGRLYKYIGPSCNGSLGFYVGPNQLGITLPNQNEPMQYSCSCPTTACNTNHVTWGVGLGKVTEVSGFCVSGYRKYCITKLGTVGLSELIKNDETNKLVYPNPANTQLNFAISKGRVRVFDSQGKLVKEKEVEEKVVMDISNLPNGLYLVEIQSDSFKGSQKLIIQH